MSLLGSFKTVTQRRTAGADAAAAQASQDRQDRHDGYNTRPDPFMDHPPQCNCYFHR